jgi:predicted transposase YdaD
VTLPLDGKLEDPTLARPVEIRALLDAVAADDAVVDALDTKGNRRLREIKAAEREQGLERGLERGLEQGLEQGLERGRVEAIETACRLLGITLDPGRRTHLLALDADGLEQLLAKLESERRWPLA